MVHSGNTEAVESFDDKDRFKIWSTVVVPMFIYLGGRENFFNLPKMVVPTVAHSSMAKKLLCLIFNGGAANGTFTEGEEKFNWSNLVVPMKHIHRWQKKLLQKIFNDAADGTFTEDEEKFNWSRMVVLMIAPSPMAKGNFFMCSSMVMTQMENSPKAKKTSVYGQVWWCQ